MNSRAQINQNSLGLALSGGGSRAAAFHRGTVQTLRELKLDSKINVVSTVSGGSLYGAAWLAAKTQNISDDDFQRKMEEELIRGFIGRSINTRILKLWLPNYSRTNLIADTFNKIFFKGQTLADLPNHPQLCINTTVLNNGQVGKFSREGLSIWEFKCPSSDPTHLAPINEMPLAIAVAASAAFPVGLPPLRLKRSIFPSDLEFTKSLHGSKSIALTDGGVLENLGIQTLLESKRFGTWNMVVSDAGTCDDPWRPRFVKNTVRSFGTWLFSGRVLDRLMLIMNSKQNRWARQRVVEQVRLSQLEEALAGKDISTSAESHSNPSGQMTKRRQLLFVRVNQNWEKMMSLVPNDVLAEIALSTGGNKSDIPSKKDPESIKDFLVSAGINLDKAHECYEKLGGRDEADKQNEIPTSFSGLPKHTVDKLALHAAWQVHATHAIYRFKMT